jgi:hypothetical protein
MALGQRARVRVGGDVEDLVRIAVAREEALEPGEIARRCSDQDRPAGAGLDQAHAPEDQRAHDPFPEVRLRQEHVPEALRRDEQGLHRAHRLAVHQRRPAGEGADLRQELARSLLDDRRHVSEPVPTGDADPPGQDDEHAPPRPARFEEPISVREAMDLAESTEALDLVGVEDRKALVAPAVGGLGLERAAVRRAHQGTGPSSLK